MSRVLSESAYKKAGVDVAAGNRLIDRIKPIVQSTSRPEVLGGLGGFSGLFSLPAKKYKSPVLVSGTDGVGTKLKIAFLTGHHDTIGIDLVAMCVNDVVVSGAEPLFFLDYFATGKLHPEIAVEVIKGIAEGCKEAGCALIGGETAEMPSFYPKGEYDLAGFSVGAVEKKKIIDGRKIRPKDLIIGLSSSGLHSNAFSLVRKILFEKKRYTVKDTIDGLIQPLGEELLTPTRIYVKAIQRIIKSITVKGCAHITGGGITENLPRIFPVGCAAQIRRGEWPVPPIFHILQKMGRIHIEEMYATFNMGIGMILVLSPREGRRCLSILKRMKQEAFVIGEIIAGDQEVMYV
ncbi:phosphoribosylformylglycinamidine cyclo-ligase [Nitrospira defluvii]|nr:phosphoribosylformylglycinamidine cyclo-ligase [Nitrospira defluvii]